MRKRCRRLLRRGMFCNHSEEDEILMPDLLVLIGSNANARFSRRLESPLLYHLLSADVPPQIIK
jgi:hypothetical protein